MDVNNLLHWALVFLGVALVSALLGFTGVMGVAMTGAHWLFWVAIILALVSFMLNMVRV